MNKIMRFLGVCVFVLAITALVGWKYQDTNREQLTFQNVEAKNKTVEEFSTVPVVYAWLGETINQKIEQTQIAKEEVEELKIPKAVDPELLQYVMDVSKLNQENASYFIGRCEELNLEVFLMLGLYKAESSFDTNHVGTSGERGLGQIMNGTGKFLCKELGISYDRDKLFEPKYNIMLSTYYVSKLYQNYSKDIHKTLTAYNRGEGGLQKYIASRSGVENPQQSSYSNNVLKYAKQYRDNYGTVSVQ